MKKSKRNYKRNSNKKRNKNYKKGGAKEGEEGEEIKEVDVKKTVSNIENKNASAADGEMCPRHKPICVNKIGKSQNALCGLAEGNFNAMDTLEHAYEIFSTNEAEALNCPKGAKDCFCTHFDYVWLETINYAQNEIKEAIAPQSQIDPKEINEGLGQIVTALETNPKPDNFFSDFFEKVLEIAKEKWEVTGTLGTNAAYLIEKMAEIKDKLEQLCNPKTKPLVLDLVTTATKETAQADEATLAAKMEEAQSNPATKEFLNIIQRFFTLGKFVLYDGNQIETLDKTILETDLSALLKDLGIGIGGEGEGEISTAGGSKTLRRKRKNRSKNKKRSNKTSKRGGKSVYTPWRIFQFTAYLITWPICSAIQVGTVIPLIILSALETFIGKSHLIDTFWSIITTPRDELSIFWDNKRAKDRGEREINKQVWKESTRLCYSLWRYINFPKNYPGEPYHISYDNYLRYREYIAFEILDYNEENGKKPTNTIIPEYILKDWARELERRDKSGLRGEKERIREREREREKEKREEREKR